MLVNISGTLRISVILDNNVVDIYHSDKWYKWMYTLRDYSISTITLYMKSVERFFIWGCKNPQLNDEPFPFYIARFRIALLNGFVIHDKDEEGYEFIVCKSQKLSKKTINKELEGIKNYYKFIDENRLFETYVIDYRYEHQRSSKGFLAGIQIKKSDDYLQLLGKREEFLKAFRTPRSTEEYTKAFPFALYDKLLTYAKPRERLIFLLCGACSARIGQVLNLTLQDIDFDKNEVWLIDSTSDQKDQYGIPRRKWLSEEYGIDANQHPEHSKKDFRFKYPIPLKRESLFWLAEDKYKNLFFKTLLEYTASSQYNNARIKQKPHPFIFMTASGARLTQSSVLRSLKNIVSKIEPSISKRKKLMNLGPHSLRHMFGSAMAEIYALTGDDSLIYICKEAMGHASISSTMKYFNMLPETKKRLISEASVKIMDLHKDKYEEKQ